MLSKTNDGTKRIEKYLLENSAIPEVNPIPKEINDNYKDKERNKITPKNTETDTYDYSDEDKADDTKW